MGRGDGRKAGRCDEQLPGRHLAVGAKIRPTSTRDSEGAIRRYSGLLSRDEAIFTRKT